jgi:mannitol-1-/sugar-/sorbitol-6-/2-deoxyglucose-6-phosphatase
MIKAAIFDMDGLLIDSEPIWFDAAVQAFETVGIKHTWEKHNKALGRGTYNAVQDWYHMEPWEGSSPKEIGDRIVKDFIEIVKEKGKAKPGVTPVLELFKSKNIPMAIASSSSPNIIDTVVDQLKIRTYFELLYSGEQEPHSKPNPGVFISTAAKLNVQPRQCLVFEDAPSGVLAAKAAHMHCVAVPEPALKDNKFVRTADVILDSLEDFDVRTLLAVS